MFPVPPSSQGAKGAFYPPKGPSATSSQCLMLTMAQRAFDSVLELEERAGEAKPLSRSFRREHPFGFIKNQMTEPLEHLVVWHQVEHACLLSDCEAGRVEPCWALVAQSRTRSEGGLKGIGWIGQATAPLEALSRAVDSSDRV